LTQCLNGWKKEEEMKVTKYPQSCLLLEKDGKRIVIDPGNFFSAHYDISELGKIEAVFYTHQHGDHYDDSIVERFKADGIGLYGNAAVAQLIGPAANVVKGGEYLNVAGFKILPHDIPHFEKPGVEMPPNTGYIVDDNFFHPGDGIINNGVKADNLTAPIAGPFGFDKVIELIKSVGAKTVIPVHYSNQEMYPCDPDSFIKSAQEFAHIILLDDGESVEL
jgi:L-ascorbate metabolism protein UlaG (beta-lactamase superfamily)